MTETAKATKPELNTDAGGRAELALLPCPFCGRPAEIDQFSVTEEYPDWQVLCGDSLCRGGIPLDEGWDTREEAIRFWQRRAR